MILVFNVFIGPDTRWFNYDRGGLPFFTKTQVLLHTLRTYSQLAFRKAFVNIEFHPDYVLTDDFEGELGQVLEGFNCPIRYTETQTKTQTAWKHLVGLVCHDLDHDNEPIWVAGNHDHPLVGKPWIIKNQIDALFSDGNPETSIIYSHWSEFLDQALIHNGTLLNDLNFVKYRCSDVHSIRVLTPYLFTTMWHHKDYGDHELPRSDWWIGGGPWDGGKILVSSPPYNSYVPLSEMCRHFDGYSHIGIPANGPQGALTIPYQERWDPKTEASVVATMNSRVLPDLWLDQVR